MKKHDFLNNDILRIFSENKELENLKHSTVLVTGTTGLIGSMTVRTLCRISAEKQLDINMIAMTRNTERARAMLSDITDRSHINFIEQDVVSEINIDGSADYIIHAAAPTKSSFFVTQPVETVKAIVSGTENVMELAKKKQSRSVVYLSSMEVYGEVAHEKLLKKSDLGHVDPLSLRSSYPMGKRMAENLCVGYCAEYGVPVKIIRLAQTFGPGIADDDNRVFAQFIRSVMAGEDIVMFTDGGSKHMYLDTMDAVSAILAVLTKGKDGEVYNAANDDTYCSIKEMAETVIKRFGEGKSSLKIDRSRNKGQYPPEHKLKLDTSDIRALGWTPHYGLTEMYERMTEYSK